MNKIVCVLAAVLVTACGGQRKYVSNNTGNASSAEVSPSATKASETVSKDSTNMDKKLSFGISLLNTAIKANAAGDNVVISPYSAGVALSMLSEGACGSTKEELQKALCGASYVWEEFTSNKNYVIASANSAWIRKGFQVLPSYQKTLESTYNAGIYERDFSSATVKEINGWCSDKTHKRIPQIMDGIKSDMVMFLLNALYFKAPWENEFSKNATSKQTFFSPSGDQRVDFLHQKEELLCGIVDGTKYVLLPYKDFEYQMVVCLPAEGVKASDVLDGLTSASLGELLDNAQYGQVTLSLPKFKVNTSLVLNDILKTMGARKIFGPQADFSAMTTSSVAVDEVLQKCFIEVNEEGSEAAAVTSIGIRLTSVGPMADTFIMNVNRPFLFAIFNASTKDILFAGNINSINQ